jgi:hypothetical protein
MASTTWAIRGDRAAFHLLHELGQTGKARLAGERQQAAFNQILLVCGQIETGMVFQELA